MSDARRSRPTPARPRPSRERRRRRVLVAVAAAIAVVVAAGVALAVDGDDGDVPRNVRVDGVAVGGLDAAALEATVRARARERLRRPVVITRTDDPGFRLEAAPAELGARAQVRRTVAAALEPRDAGGRLLARIGLGDTREVELGFTLDRERVDDLVARVTRGVNRPPRPAGLDIGADAITVVPAQEGFGIDADALREQIAALPGTIPLTPATLAPTVDDAAAERARQRALALSDAPVSVTLQGRGVEIEAAVLRSALRVRTAPPELEVGLDPPTLYADIASAFSSREQPARDAELRITGDRVRVIPSRIGRGLDMPAIAAAIAADPAATAVRARFRVTRPETTTDQLTALKITELISSFSTPYNCCEPRVTNIQRAAEILDGVIIPAGGRFSLNEALGQRTVERGFVEAPQIAAGRLEDAVGGGVSQVATTLFNAAFFAGLDLVAHTPHQFWISRYPKGREATVSFGGPELIFVNDWDAAILMSVTAGSNDISVRFYSSPLGRRVQTTTGEPTDYVEPTTREEVDRSLAPGERIVEQEPGGAGFTITYTRTIHVGDDVRDEETFRWTYDPADGYVKVGPKRPRPARPDRTTTEPDDAPEPPPTSTAPPAGGAATPAGTAPAAPAAPPPG